MNVLLISGWTKMGRLEIIPRTTEDILKEFIKNKYNSGDDMWIKQHMISRYFNAELNRWKNRKISNYYETYWLSEKIIKENNFSEKQIKNIKNIIYDILDSIRINLIQVD